MKLSAISTACLLALLIARPAIAADADLKQRIFELEQRMLRLEQRMEEINSKDRWRDPTLWNQVKKEMNAGQIRKLLGKPNRVEEHIFTTWYYHPTSKLHGFVWFDNTKVLGWKPPEK